MSEAVSVRAKGAAMMAVGAFFGLFALGFAALAGSAALKLVLPAWAAHLIVAGAFTFIAGGLFLAGRRGMRKASTTPKRTRETLKEDARWVRQQIAR
jgi:Putative Actinobacterial Holin-X, holin superfamily III